MDLRNSYQPEGRILVALSGGADSVALLCMLHEQGADLQALHCNFHLRGEESDRDEYFVTLLCQRLNITLHIKHFETRAYAAQQHVSLEMAARELRYAWFEEMRQQLGADDIAVAHHREDQAETLLLNLIRGTGLRGLAGMQERNGHIVRPLLHTSKADILQYLDSRGQDYVTDSTNLERNALRNRIRLDVVPLLQQLNPQAVQHIAEAAQHVAEALPYFQRGVDISTALSRTTLHERLHGLGFTPSQEQQMWQSQRSGATFESPTHRATFQAGHLVVEAKTTGEPLPCLTTHRFKVPDPLAWVTRESMPHDTCVVDARLVSHELTIRHPRPGDRFRPFGMKGRTRLLADFLAERGLSVFERQRQWLVCQGDNIVWVVGHRIDDHYRISSATQEILQLSINNKKINERTYET